MRAASQRAFIRAMLDFFLRATGASGMRCDMNAAGEQKHWAARKVARSTISHRRDGTCRYHTGLVVSPRAAAARRGAIARVDIGADICWHGHMLSRRPCGAHRARAYNKASARFRRDGLLSQRGLRKISHVAASTYARLPGFAEAASWIAAWRAAPPSPERALFTSRRVSRSSAAASRPDAKAGALALRDDDIFQAIEHGLLARRHQSSMLLMARDAPRRQVWHGSPSASFLASRRRHRRRCVAIGQKR